MEFRQARKIPFSHSMLSVGIINLSLVSLFVFHPNYFNLNTNTLMYFADTGPQHTNLANAFPSAGTYAFRLFLSGDRRLVYAAGGEKCLNFLSFYWRKADKHLYGDLYLQAWMCFKRKSLKVGKMLLKGILQCAG